MSVEDNKAIIHREVDAVWNTGDSDVIDQVMAPSYVGDDPSGFHSGTLEQFKQTAKAAVAGLCGVHVNIKGLNSAGGQGHEALDA